jgi:hypothetical protein
MFYTVRPGDGLSALDSVACEPWCVTTERPLTMFVDRTVLYRDGHGYDRTEQ